ncbi:CRE-GEI-13 protein [Aphelenchoides avenae]|nr:CRE-GEI-13 protein [Aphelenchus avenae]
MNSNGIGVNLFNGPIPAVPPAVPTTQFNEPTSSMKVLTDLLSTQTPLASTLKQEKLTPFEAMIKHEPLPADSFDASKTVTPAALAETLGSPGSLDRRQKRKRLRRHPVWQYFCDVDEKIVGCVMCTFRTVSAFSTNLKMHLKAHHKEEYLKVMEQELEQRQDEESMGVGSEESSQSQEATANGRFKRRRRTVEELQVIVEKAKSTLEKDKWRQTINGSLLAGPQFIANPTPVLDTEKMAGMSATEKLEAMVGFLCADNGSSEAGLPSPATEYSDSEQQNSTEASSSPVEPCEGTLGADALVNSDGNPEDFRALMRQISKIPSEGANGQFVKNFKRQTQTLMLSKLVKRVGSASIFLTPEFQNFVLSWAPDFQLPSADELHSMLAKNGYKH